MADLVPVDHQPEFDEADQAAMMPETFVNPAVKSAIESTTKLLAAPGNIAKPNPYPEGSEEASWYEDQRQKGMTDWSPEMALAMLGGGAGGVEGGGATVGSGPLRKGGLPGSATTDAYKAAASVKPISEMTDQELAAWRAQNAADDAERARTFGARRAAADTPAERRAQAQRAQENAADDASMNLEDKGTTLGSGATDKKTAATLQAIRGELDMSPEARAARAKEQGYTIDAYKGGQPYDWKTMPETNFKGEVIPGTENRVPQELTSINSPNAPYAGFFSNTPAVADRFAAPFEHGAVWPTKLKFDNPLVIDAEGKHAAAFQFDTIAQRNGTTDKMNQFKGAFAEGSPHDGVILKNTKDEGDVYVPRDPDQVRSRFAAFDPANKGSGTLLGSGATDKKTAATIQAIRGLDMNQDARLARAGEQGYDTSTPLYHGTSKDADFKKFKDSRHGTWTTTDPESASMYARENDSKGLVYDRGKYEPVNSADRVLPLYGKPLQNPYTGPVPDSIRTASNYKKAQSDWFDQLKRQGYDGVDMGGGVRVDFNNANLRSQFAPFDPKNQGKSMLLGSGATDQKTAAMLQAIRAYHGSPHDFDAFDLSKIGTGEGAQAYGHGLYFAEHEPTAESYRNALAPGYQRTLNGVPFENLPSDAHKTVAQWMAGTGAKPDEVARIADERAAQTLKDAAADGSDLAQMVGEMTAKRHTDIANAAREIAKTPATIGSQSRGRMYEVNINADPEHFLDWDKPLHEQSQYVKDAIAKHDASLSTQPPSLTQIKDPEIRSIVRRAVKANDGQAQGLEMTIDNDRGLYDAASKHAQRNKIDLDAQDMRASDYVYQQAKPYIDALHASQSLAGDSLGKLLGVKGADAMQSGPAAARLRDVGIPGIKYLDAGSRAGGEGSRNYVVFNDKLIDILRKYGIAGLPAAGAATGAMQAQPGPADMVNAIRGQGGG